MVAEYLVSLCRGEPARTVSISCHRLCGRFWVLYSGVKSGIHHLARCVNYRRQRLIYFLDASRRNTGLSLIRGYLILLASMLVTFVLCSVHAFSVFVLPLEQLLNLPRSDISLIYSLALVAITVSVLFGYLIYTRLAAWWLVLVACLLAASGLVLASRADSWWQLMFGYSLLFGGANGVGYGYTLQLAARELSTRKGLAMGAVTAAYAVGSIVFAKIFAIQIESVSVAAAFIALATGLVTCGLLSAVIMYLARASFAGVENIDRC